jgi:hypothetical protein
VGARFFISQIIHQSEPLLVLCLPLEGGSTLSQGGWHCLVEHRIRQVPASAAQAQGSLNRQRPMATTNPLRNWRIDLAQAFIEECLS